jgi:hypothetical protein
MLIMKYRVIHITARSFLPEWSEADETCLRSFASGCQYCVWVIFGGLNRWSWVALIVSEWVLLHCIEGTTCHTMWPPDLKSPDLFFWLPGGVSIQEWTSCHVSFERQHLTWDCQHKKLCPACKKWRKTCIIMSVWWRVTAILNTWCEIIQFTTRSCMCHLYFIPWIHYEIGLYDLGILYESLCILIRMNVGG